MKILFANSMKGLGGGERWLLDVASGLQARGHRTWVAGRAGSPLLARAQAKGLGVVPAPFTHDLDLPTVAMLRAFNQAERPHLAVAQIQRAHRVCALASQLGPAVPLVLRVGQLWPVRKKLINRWAWGRLELALANCQAISTYLESTGLIPPRRLRVLHNGLEIPSLPERHRARAALGIGEGNVLVACVARLARRKGHETLLRAWRMVASRLPEARLLLVGGGSEERHLRLLAERLGISGSVLFAGELEDVSPVWAGADLSVLPSELEGLPYAILESMAAGVPCVATRVAGVPELLTHERSGLLVPPREPEAMAREIVRAARDRELRRALVSEARKAVAREFSFAEMLERAEALFTEAAGV